MKDSNLKCQLKRKRNTETINLKANIVQELITETETIIKMVKIKFKVNKVVKEEGITTMGQLVRENQGQTIDQNKRIETQLPSNKILILH